MSVQTTGTPLQLLVPLVLSSYPPTCPNKMDLTYSARVQFDVTTLSSVTHWFSFAPWTLEHLRARWNLWIIITFISPSQYQTDHFFFFSRVHYISWKWSNLKSFHLKQRWCLKDWIWTWGLCHYVFSEVGVCYAVVHHPEIHNSTFFFVVAQIHNVHVRVWLNWRLIPIHLEKFCVFFFFFRAKPVRVPHGNTWANRKPRTVLAEKNFDSHPISFSSFQKF